MYNVIATGQGHCGCCDSVGVFCDMFQEALQEIHLPEFMTEAEVEAMHEDGRWQAFEDGLAKYAGKTIDGAPKDIAEADAWAQEFVDLCKKHFPGFSKDTLAGFFEDEQKAHRSLVELETAAV